MRAILLIALGSGMGGVARYLVSSLVEARAGNGFPWGTLAVNLIGSLLIGALAALNESMRGGVSAGVREFLMIGLLGGFTTFSAFSLQTLRLLQTGDWGRAGGNVLVSVAGCLVAVALGYRLARMAA